MIFLLNYWPWVIPALGRHRFCLILQVRERSQIRGEQLFDESIFGPNLNPSHGLRNYLFVQMGNLMQDSLQQLASTSAKRESLIQPKQARRIKSIFSCGIPQDRYGPKTANSKLIQT